VFRDAVVKACPCVVHRSVRSALFRRWPRRQDRVRGAVTADSAGLCRRYPSPSRRGRVGGVRRQGAPCDPILLRPTLAPWTACPSPATPARASPPSRAAAGGWCIPLSCRRPTAPRRRRGRVAGFPPRATAGGGCGPVRTTSRASRDCGSSAGALAVSDWNTWALGRHGLGRRYERRPGAFAVPGFGRGPFPRPSLWVEIVRVPRSLPGHPNVGADPPANPRGVARVIGSCFASSCCRCCRSRAGVSTRVAGVASLRKSADDPYGFVKSATCFPLSDVNGDRSQPPHRSSRSMPAIFAIRTSSEGQMYRYGAE
jgi:hypothetical protein